MKLENMLNLQINIPYELNRLDVRELLTSAWQTKRGGWIDLMFPWEELDIGGWPFDSSWLAYSYQTASSNSIGANWSVLHGVHREVGTLAYDNDDPAASQ